MKKTGSYMRVFTVFIMEKFVMIIDLELTFKVAPYSFCIYALFHTVII